MEQLEERTYSRAEIAAIIGVADLHDTHFARKVKDTLSKWGYEYEYRSAAVTISKKPETAEERLSELMMRGYGLDIQVNVKKFAVFLFLLLADREFATMPWGERAKRMTEMYDAEITEGTLRNWTSKMFATGSMEKSHKKDVYWRTRFDAKGVKVRERVDETLENERLYYFERLYATEQENEKEGMERSEAWKLAYKQVWTEFGCCYYGCSQLNLNALDAELDEIIGWVEVIIRKEWKQ